MAMLAAGNTAGLLATDCGTALQTKASWMRVNWRPVCCCNSIGS